MASRLPFDSNKVPCNRIPSLLRLWGGPPTQAGRKAYVMALRNARQELSGRKRKFDLKYPDLPVVDHKQEFLQLLQKHQVVIVQADTGSGKSTQLPKFLLEAGYSDRGRIGVTQPRRIAALTIADRLREETEDATLVSTRIRFLEEGPADARIKVMTDGILLQEFRKDRLFNQYSCILLDEAHERSLNIDILLGILRGVVETRPDFRLVIASATMDAKLFQDFFPGSTVMEAAGRLYPVEVEYRPAGTGAKGKGDSGLVDEAAQAVLDLMGHRPDHLLCFLPTERDISELADVLRRELEERRYEIIPLFGRLGPQEQRRAFKDGGKVRVVLATNIAETSLTIPGIAYVVDTGTARISRYSPASRIQGLPVEPVSQAAAEQRKGRAGRVKPGICIRLYAQDDLARRIPFTEPEILRSNLSNVVLQLRDLGLREEEFPFLQSPNRSAFRGACKHLHELGALDSPDSQGNVTSMGREMAKLPIDVSLAAVLLRAREMSVLQPALIVCAALCILDPRIVPSEEPERTKAREKHRSFGGKGSDFLAYVSLWNTLADKRGENGGWGPVRRFCEENWLHFLRVREWTDLYEQFCRVLGVEFAERKCIEKNFNLDNLHRSILYGFLGVVATKSPDGPGYRLAGSREAHIFPGSELAKRQPKWVVAAEVRETSRVFLNKVCEVRPDWIEAVAGDLCTRRWYQPYWSRERGFVEAMEEVSFRGLVLSRGRPVDYARIDPDACADIFWHEAVVEGDVPRPLPFMSHNASVLAGLSDLEKRLRRHGIRPSADALARWYKEKCPGILNWPALRDWVTAHGDQTLRLNPQDWIDQVGEGASLPDVRTGFALADALSAASKKHSGQGSQPNTPKGGTQKETWKILGTPVSGELVFDHANSRDGITLDLPLDLWAKLTPALLAYEIGAWRGWMLDALLRDLPGKTRERLLPQKNDLEELWLDALKTKPQEAPEALLLQCLRSLPDGADASAGLDPEKEHHLRLHLRLLAESAPSTEGKQPTPLSIELRPDWDVASAFIAIKDIMMRHLGPNVLHLPMPTGIEGIFYGVAISPQGKLGREFQNEGQAKQSTREAQHIKAGESAQGDAWETLCAKIRSLDASAGDLSPGGVEWRSRALAGALVRAKGKLPVLPPMPALADRGGVRLRELSQLTAAGGGPERNSRAAVFALALYAAPADGQLFLWYWDRAIEAATAYARGKSAGPSWEKAATLLRESPEHGLALAVACACSLGWEGIESLPGGKAKWPTDLEKWKAHTSRSEDQDRQTRARRKAYRGQWRLLLSDTSLDSARVKKLRDVLSALESNPLAPGSTEQELEALRLACALQIERLEANAAELGGSHQAVPEVEGESLSRLKGRFGKL